MKLRTDTRPIWVLPGLVLLLALGTWVRPADGQMLQKLASDSPRGATEVTYSFEISGQSPEPPIMKYRLLPSHSELTEGNGAQLYHRAILLISQASSNVKNSAEYWKKLDEWRTVPPDQFPEQEVVEVLRPYEFALQEAAYGARRTYCHWELPTRENGTNLLGIWLPEIQELRTVARLLALRIRLRMAQGRFDDAIYDLQTGYSLARHVGNRDFLVNALVGIAIGGMMDEQLLNVISYPSTRNLYWSIANLPTPVVDITNSMEIERDTYKAIFPELLEASENKEDQTYWDQRLTEVMSRMVGLMSHQRSDSTPWDTIAFRIAVFSQVPRVKQELVADMGFDEREIEAMPGSRAILLYSLNDLQRKRDAFLAPIGLPYYQAKRFYDVGPQWGESITSGDPLGLARTLLPSLPAVHKAATRDACWLAMLRTTEAIRDYAKKQGKLPTSLDLVTDLPIPMNPYTNQPFLYQLDVANPMKAILEEKDSNLPQRFEITLRQP